MPTKTIQPQKARKGDIATWHNDAGERFSGVIRWRVGDLLDIKRIEPAPGYCVVLTARSGLSVERVCK